MATWKVGDRFRVGSNNVRTPHLVGCTGVIVSIGGSGRDGTDCWVILEDSFDYLAASFNCLLPLTPPGQKEFKAEDVLTLEGLPDFNIPTMPPEFARAWGGA